jgi:tetratricopeptide (TPR) repeat protein
MLKLHHAILLSAALTLSAPAWSAPDSSGGSPDEASSTKRAIKVIKRDSPKTLKCKKGEVVKRVKRSGKFKRICVRLKAGLLNDEQLYEQGRELAAQGEYDWSLSVLAAITNQDDPRVLNYQGYSNRKAGRIDAGIVFYRRALSIDPDYVLAREYLGEGYVAAGKIELAKVELAEIAKRCGTDCTEYKMLLKHIDRAVN